MSRWRALGPVARVLCLAGLWGIVAVLRVLFVMDESLDVAIAAAAMGLAVLVGVPVAIGLSAWLVRRGRGDD